VLDGGDGLGRVATAASVMRRFQSSRLRVQCGHTLAA
jgi:hypothetical protein